MSHKATLPSASIGLNPDRIDEASFNDAVYKYIAREHSKRGLMGDTLEQAPVPKSTVGEANNLRKRILQMSIAPDIYMNKHLKIKSPNRLG
jgi:hypothetical protein